MHVHMTVSRAMELRPLHPIASYIGPGATLILTRHSISDMQKAWLPWLLYMHIKCSLSLSLWPQLLLVWKLG